MMVPPSVGFCIYTEILMGTVISSCFRILANCQSRLRCGQSEDRASPREPSLSVPGLPRLSSGHQSLNP